MRTWRCSVLPEPSEGRRPLLWLSALTVLCTAHPSGLVQVIWASVQPPPRLRDTPNVGILERGLFTKCPQRGNKNGRGNSIEENPREVTGLLRGRRTAKTHLVTSKTSRSTTLGPCMWWGTGTKPAPPPRARPSGHQLVILMGSSSPATLTEQPNGLEDFTPPDMPT